MNLRHWSIVFALLLALTSIGCKDSSTGRASTAPTQAAKGDTEEANLAQLSPASVGGLPTDTR